MDRFLTRKQLTSFIATLLTLTLSGCVTQDFENGETPVVQNQANRDDMAATRISLGLGYLKMGNMPQAKQNLEKAKNFSPDMVQVYTAFAHYYETVGEHELTVESYEKALSLKSDDADTLNNYGVYLCRQDQVEAAEKQFLKAIAVPSYILVAKSYENLFSCFLQKDNFVKAESYLNKAILHSPGSASILFQMVRLQYAIGNYKKAKHFVQRFEKITRRFSSQSLALAYKVHFKLGQRRTAKNYGTMLVKMYPQSWEAQQYLLNELELIEADNLAKRYQLTKVSTQPAKPKKRIVKLSPRKTSVAKTAPKIEAQTQKLAVPEEKEASKVSLPATKSISLPTASTASINAALTTDVIETTTDSSQLANKSLERSEAVEKVIGKTPTELTSQDKTVVVLNAPVTDKSAEMTKDSIAEVVKPVEAKVIEVKADAVSAESTTTASEAISNEATPDETTHTEATPIEDTEIFHVAKRPPPIIEDPAEEIAEIKVVGKKDLKQLKKENQPVKKETKLAVKEPDEKEKAKNFPDFHVVEAGDTLYNISVKYNIKLKALRKWNKISKKKKIHIKDIIFLENPKLVNQ